MTVLTVAQEFNPGSALVAINTLRFAHPIVLTYPGFEAGRLRLAGDSPDGLVLVGAAPAARTVDVFDRATRAWVGTTVSSGAGTYEISNLAARTEGYDVIIRGVIGSGERDVIVPGVHPG